MGPKSNDWCPYKRRVPETETHRQEKSMWRQRQRLEGHVNKPRIPRIISNRQKLGERLGTDPPQHTPEGTSPVDTLISGF